MTNIFNTYSFMDLLKDYNYVPTAVQSKISIFQIINNLIEKVSGLITDKTTDYDFMDLLGDNGYVPVNDNWIKSSRNDNGKIINIAS